MNDKIIKNNFADISDDDDFKQVDPNSFLMKGSCIFNVLIKNVYINKNTKAAMYDINIEDDHSGIELRLKKTYEEIFRFHEKIENVASKKRISIPLLPN